MVLVCFLTRCLSALCDELESLLQKGQDIRFTIGDGNCMFKLG
jgi:hypothetical protein